VKFFVSAAVCEAPAANTRSPHSTFPTVSRFPRAPAKAPGGWRTLQNASRISEIIVQRASVLDCGGPPPLSFRDGAQLLPQGSLSENGCFSEGDLLQQSPARLRL
jgi:hypothetical protein